MAKMTGGELLVRTLREHGVRHVFSIIGGQMCSVYDALSREPEMELFNPRTEAAVPVMAAGCAAESGVPTVSMCTVGAGVVYEVSGLIAADRAYLPVISIAPQVQSWKMKPHQENLQGCDQDLIFAPLVKWNAIVQHRERVPQLVARALREALANAPGPVHLDVPVDVLFKRGPAGAKTLARLIPPAARTRYQGAIIPPRAKLEAAAQALASAKRPLVALGQGFGRPGRYPDLHERLNRLGAPTLLSSSSAAAMTPADLSFVGLVRPFSQSDPGRAVLEQADLLLIIGLDSEVIDLSAGLKPGPRQAIHLETDPAALPVETVSRLAVNADPLSFLDGLGRPGPWTEWIETVRAAAGRLAADEARALPGLAGVMRDLSATLEGEEVLVIDGFGPVRAAALLGSARYRRLYVMDVEGLAGSGLPFALGVKVASPDRRVILIADQDSLFRRLQELTTAWTYGLGLEAICVDPGQGPALERTTAILSGLGCEVRAFSPDAFRAGAASKRVQVWLGSSNRG